MNKGEDIFGKVSRRSAYKRKREKITIIDIQLRNRYILHVYIDITSLHFSEVTNFTSVKMADN